MMTAMESSRLAADLTRDAVDGHTDRQIIDHIRGRAATRDDLELLLLATVAVAAGLAASIPGGREVLEGIALRCEVETAFGSPEEHR